MQCEHNYIPIVYETVTPDLIDKARLGELVIGSFMQEIMYKPEKFCTKCLESYPDFFDYEQD